MKERVGISMANDCIRTDLAVEIREKLEKAAKRAKARTEQMADKAKSIMKERE